MSCGHPAAASLGAAHRWQQPHDCLPVAHACTACCRCRGSSNRTMQALVFWSLAVSPQQNACISSGRRVFLPTLLRGSSGVLCNSHRAQEYGRGHRCSLTPCLTAA
eukprot:GHRQ01005169.1.p3 GENE.GHRQ01005169.1~~GHRQ01005169.1.p3  ORF type:complete len:106 (+),score=12.96 GHRQ01005169.1:747-1064(+)